MSRRVGKKRKCLVNSKGVKLCVGDVVRSQIGTYTASYSPKGIIRKFDGNYAEVLFDSTGKTRSMARSEDYRDCYSPTRMAAELEHTRGRGYVESVNIDYLVPVGRAKRIPTLHTAEAPGYGSSAAGVWEGKGKAPRRKKVGGRLVANLGDRDPFSYGGFLVFKEGKDYNAVRWQSNEEENQGPVTVYRFDIPTDVFADKTWVKPAEIASSIGEDEFELVKQGRSKDVIQRALVVRDIGETWGYDNLDTSPDTMTEKELKSLYGRALEGLYKRERK